MTVEHLFHIPEGVVPATSLGMQFYQAAGFCICAAGALTGGMGERFGDSAGAGSGGTRELLLSAAGIGE